MTEEEVTRRVDAMVAAMHEEFPEVQQNRLRSIAIGMLARLADLMDSEQVSITWIRAQAVQAAASLGGTDQVFAARTLKIVNYIKTGVWAP